jgi:hypothetical protein
LLPSEAAGADREFLDVAVARVGAVIGGRHTYEVAEALGRPGPFGVPFFIVPQRREAAHTEAGFRSYSARGCDHPARAVGGKDVFVMGAGVDPSGVRAGHVDAVDLDRPVVLGGGELLFNGFRRVRPHPRIQTEIN